MSLIKRSCFLYKHSGVWLVTLSTVTLTLPHWNTHTHTHTQCLILSDSFPWHTLSLSLFLAGPASSWEVTMETTVSHRLSQSPLRSRTTSAWSRICILLNRMAHHGLYPPTHTHTHTHTHRWTEWMIAHERDVLRLSAPVRRCSSGSSLAFARVGPSPPHGQATVTPTRRLSLGGGRTFQLSPQGSSEDRVHFQNHIRRFRSHSFPPKLYLGLCIE